MIWRFSDGTLARLGGEIDGDSLFAQELRAALAEGATVQVDAHPAPPVALNASDPAQFNAWLRAEMAAGYRKRDGLRLLEAPAEVPALPKPAARPWLDALSPEKRARLLF